MKLKVLTEARKAAIAQNIEELSTPRRSFYVMVVLSTVIACYGLLSNSTAVVIGAMLVAPLMGPIFGIALSLTSGDRWLLRKSLISEGFGVLLALAVGALIGLVPLRLGFGSEVMARTQPNIYDIIIALASGLAGAYAMIDEKIGPALPGVAIATALVPPLATCGLVLASGRWDLAGGAFLLFFVNLLAIELAAAIVFTLYNLTDVRLRDNIKFIYFIKRFYTSIIMLAIIGFFMTQTLAQLAQAYYFKHELQRLLSREISVTSGAKLSDVSHKRYGSKVEVVATVLTPSEFKASQVESIENLLTRAFKVKVYLVVRSIISKDADRNGTVYIDVDELQKSRALEEQKNFLSQVSQVLKSQLKQLAGANLDDVRRENENGRIIIMARVNTPKIIEPAQVKNFEQALRKVLNAPMRLVVSSVLTKDADANNYLYEPAQKLKTWTATELRWNQRLQRAVTSQLKAVPGAGLQELRQERQGGRIRLYAAVQAPEVIKPAQVKQMELNLKKYIHPALELRVHTSVGADAGASGYVKPSHTNFWPERP